jgi:hypothetical protein
VYLAEAQLGLGDGEAARSTAERAIRLAEEAGTRGWEARAYLVLARILRALDGAAARDGIAACFARAGALVAETGACAQTPFIIEERARLAMVLGDARGAERLSEEARRSRRWGRPATPRGSRASSRRARGPEPAPGDPGCGTLPRGRAGWPWNPRCVGIASHLPSEP